jgi:four helix bundle protein
MRDYRNLDAWQRAHRLVLDLYRETERYPDVERFGLISQTRRAASSIPTNISEGSGRQSDTEFSRFLTIAIGSAVELEYHLLLARDLGYLDGSRHAILTQELGEVRAMLVGVRSHAQRRGLN